MAIRVRSARRLGMVTALWGVLGGGAGAQPVPPNPAGLWLTQNQGGVIRIAPCGAGLCGTIVGSVLDHPDDPAPVDYRGRPHCGLTIIEVAPGAGDSAVWSGRITDPRSGQVYRAELRTAPPNRLLLRGYVVVPLFGQTQTWTRYSGIVRADCRLSAADIQRQAVPDAAAGTTR